ncbi:hypothetical protein V8C35DRAFT_306957 [Trichoderma chlorosporum]
METTSGQREQREETTYPWRSMRYKGRESLCALCLEPCRACSQRQTGCLNRLEGQVATTAELWVASGERASHSSQQQNGSRRTRAGCSEHSTVPVSRSWEGVGQRRMVYCSSLVVRRGKERADREWTRRRMSVQRLREDGGGQDAEL